MIAFHPDPVGLMSEGFKSFPVVWRETVGRVPVVEAVAKGYHAVRRVGGHEPGHMAECGAGVIWRKMLTSARERRAFFEVKI